MLGALLGALAGVAHKAAEAVEEVGERTGMPKWITGGLSGALTLAGDGLDAGKDVQLPNIGDGLAFAGDKIKTAFGGSFSTESATPVAAKKLGRSADFYNVGSAPLEDLQSKDPHFANFNTIETPVLNIAAAKQRNAGFDMSA